MTVGPVTIMMPPKTTEDSQLRPAPYRSASEERSQPRGAPITTSLRTPALASPSFLRSSVSPPSNRMIATATAISGSRTAPNSAAGSSIPSPARRRPCRQHENDRRELEAPCQPLRSHAKGAHEGNGGDRSGTLDASIAMTCRSGLRRRPVRQWNPCREPSGRATMRPRNWRGLPRGMAVRSGQRVQPATASSGVARLSTRKKPAMSVIVVSSGPLATAGSCPMRLSSRGTTPPMDTAMTC